jgi:hypothetical protein
VAGRLRPPGRRHRRSGDADAVAVDGKSMRGTASGGHDRPVHLLAAVGHADGLRARPTA